MEQIINNTEIYIWNDNGLINTEELNFFCEEISKKSMFKFNIEKKSLSTYFYLSKKKSLNIDFYDNGYVFFVEGEILNCILFLYEFDRFFKQNHEFYISPIQRLDENTKFLFKRGMKIKEIGEFLDKIFRNKDYSQALKEILPI
ncbi:hypothetical protein KRX57_07685 [Weeksellaceae bacterium TAE3-ERU29]|nr:hypothetical protein [Weeksellaceae bacterium TAE3-ERU29]